MLTSLHCMIYELMTKMSHLKKQLYEGTNILGLGNSKINKRGYLSPRSLHRTSMPVVHVKLDYRSVAFSLNNGREIDCGKIGKTDFILKGRRRMGVLRRGINTNQLFWGNSLYIFISLFNMHLLFFTVYLNIP